MVNNTNFISLTLYNDLVTKKESSTVNTSDENRTISEDSEKYGYTTFRYINI